jgi:hypothetical protein
VPCNRLVPAGPKDKYHLGGKGLTNSNDFDLAEGIRAAQINVRAGTKLGKIVGIILTAVGIPMLLSGTLSMVSYGLLKDPQIQAQLAANGTALPDPTVNLVLGIVELAVGVGAGTTGLILWPTNTTVMSLQAVEPPGPPPGATPPAEVAPSTPPEPAEASPAP